MKQSTIDKKEAQERNRIRKDLLNMGLKMCSKCRVIKPVTEFYRSGIKNQIRECYGNPCRTCLSEQTLKERVDKGYIRKANRKLGARYKKPIKYIHIDEADVNAMEFIRKLIHNDFIVYGRMNCIIYINDIITHWTRISPVIVKYSGYKTEKQIQLMIEDLVNWYSARNIDR